MRKFVYLMRFLLVSCFIFTLVIYLLYFTYLPLSLSLLTLDVYDDIG